MGANQTSKDFSHRANKGNGVENGSQKRIFTTTYKFVRGAPSKSEKNGVTAKSVKITEEINEQDLE